MYMSTPPPSGHEAACEICKYQFQDCNVNVAYMDTRMAILENHYLILLVENVTFSNTFSTTKFDKLHKIDILI